ncbi:MAG: PucR family transcriptional regulator [Tractidigestivibacter sp.]|jgi:hypothetical protein|uniref:PucR family transcriptional regulator n=1 Tax=Tractidigestivibacter sp. TaxID=2847320 RepID=UPI003D946C2D
MGETPKDLSEKKLALFEALLSGAGIQHMLDAAFEVLGNPIFVSDMGLNVLCICRDHGRVIKPQDLFGDATDTVLDDAIMAGDLAHVYDSDKTVEGWYPKANRKCIAARVRYNSDLMGHVVVVETNRKFTDEDRELLPTIAQIVSYSMRMRGSNRSQSVPYWNLMRSMLDGSLTDAEECNLMARRAGLKVPERMILLVLRPRKNEGRISPFYLRQQLLNTFAGSFGIEQDDENIHVVNAAPGTERIIATLKKRVYVEPLAIGVSESFGDLLALRDAYCQADAALRLVDVSAGSIVRYRSVMFSHLGEIVRNSGYEQCFSLPELELLQKIDQRDGTSHVDDLAAYLSCGCNVNKAAEMLHVHKNTLYYRLSRISEVSGIDLSDTEECALLALRLRMSGHIPS